MLRRVRTVLASVVFLLITLMFVDASGTLHKWLSWLADIQFWPAVLAINVGVIVLLVAATHVFGRIYCSVVCPLGIMQDIISRLHSRGKKNRFRHTKGNKVLRYSFLAVFIVAFAAGVGSIVALLEPYSSYGRMAENLLRPIWGFGNNVLASIAERIDSYTFYSVDVWVKSLPTFAIVVVIFVVVGFLAWRGGRTYCNAVCPVGTVLSLLARFSCFKVRIDADKCVSCNLCSRNCKASCIDIKNHRIDYSRCVVCGNCIDKCREHAIAYTARKLTTTGNVAAGQAPAGRKTVDASRRSFLFVAAAATSAAAIGQDKKKVDGGLAVIEDKVAFERATPLTPPGSISAQNMTRRCTACQLCVSQCPNGVLRPSSGLLSLMQPTMSYERGYCRPECTRCSTVCPTGAIQPITREEKSSIQIGHAVWVKKNCVPLTDGVKCDNCARHCPTGAITMVSSDPKDRGALKIPAVNEARCIGCGACENLCPARPFSAIYVEGHEQHREI